MIMVSGQGVLGIEAEDDDVDDLVESSSVLVSIASSATSPSGRSPLRSVADEGIANDGADDDTVRLIGNKVKYMKEEERLVKKKEKRVGKRRRGTAGRKTKRVVLTAA